MDSTGPALRPLPLLAGPLAALAIYWLAPAQYTDATGAVVALPRAAAATLGVLAWMAVWWITEVVDLTITALLPAVAFPALGIATMRDACAPYASDTVFLFMGGFLLAQSMMRWGLDRRIALLVLRVSGTSPARMVGGVMLVTGVISGFVSNTATAAMMLPITLSILRLVTGGEDDPRRMDDDQRNFGASLLIGTAFAASVGGMASLIGTPPNTLVSAYLRTKIAEPLRVDLTFADWMRFGLPATMIFLPFCWWLLTRVLHPVRFKEVKGGRAFLDSELKALGPVKPAEWITLTVFGCAVAAWLLVPMLRQWAKDLPPDAGGWAALPGLRTALLHATDAGIALTAAFLLFLLPAGRGGMPVMDWPHAVRLPWGVLLLFGGGLSLADAMETHQVAGFITAQALFLKHMPVWIFLPLLLASVIALSEFASNTAVAAALIPILAGLAPALGLHPYQLILPAAFACSCGFMLPVATPPNTLFFGTGRIRARDMMRAGLWMNLFGVVLSTAIGWLFARYLMGRIGAP